MDDDEFRKRKQLDVTKLQNVLVHTKQLQINSNAKIQPTVSSNKDKFFKMRANQKLSINPIDKQIVADMNKMHQNPAHLSKTLAILPKMDKKQSTAKAAVNPSMPAIKNQNSKLRV